MELIGGDQLSDSRELISYRRDGWLRRSVRRASAILIWNS